MTLAIGLRKHCLLEPLPERRDRDAVQDFGAEGISQQVACRDIRQPAALQVEHFFGIELADRRTVRAFDVVSKDLELRLGIDARPAVEQQVAARLR